MGYFSPTKSVIGSALTTFSGKTAVALGDSITGYNNGVIVVSGIVRTSGVSVATSTSHGLATGNTVRIYNTADASFGGYGGWFTVTRIDANTFSYVQTGLADGSAGACVALKTSLYDDRGYFNWLNAIMGQPFSLLRNAGVAGEQTDQIFNRIDTDVIPLSPDFCFVLGGINDVSNGITAAVIKSNLQAIYQKLLAKGITVVALTIMPYGSGHAKYTVANTQTIVDVNDWIKRFCLATAGMVFVDAFAAIVNPTGTGAAASGMLYDNLHPAPKGAIAIATAAKTVLQNRVFIPSVLVSSNSDNYVASTSNNNIWDSGPWSATGGTVNAPATGTAATGFVVEAGAGSPTITASCPARADGYGYNQRAVITAAAANDIARIRASGAMPSRLAAGTYEMVFDIAVSGVSGSNLSKVNWYVNVTLDGTAYAPIGSIISTSSNGAPVADFSGQFRSAPILIPAFSSCTVASFYFDFTFSASGTAMTVDIGRVSFRKIA